jgi:hypothetical protein
VETPPVHADIGESAATTSTEAHEPAPAPSAGVPAEATEEANQRGDAPAEASDAADDRKSGG